MAKPQQPLPISTVDVFKCLVRHRGVTAEALQAAIDLAIERARARHFPMLGKMHFLDTRKGRGLLGRVKEKAAEIGDGDGEEFFRALANLCARVPLRLDDFLQRVPAPLDTFREGSKVVLMLGKRPFSAMEGATERWYIDEHDQMAADFIESCLMTLGIGCQVEQIKMRRNVSTATALERLQTLHADQTVGAIVVIGSAVSNSATSPMASMILAGREPAAWLSWKFELEDPTLPQDPLALDAIGERGIELRDGQWYARTDTEDAGILMVSRVQRSRKPPLVLAACVGHGGAATYASARAFMRHFDIAERLKGEGPWDEPDYVFAPITVHGSSEDEPCWRFITPDEDEEREMTRTDKAEGKKPTLA